LSEWSKEAARLGGELAKLHHSFPPGEKTTAIHLFGIKFGDELSQLTRAQLDEVSKAAGLKPIYGVELRKMAKLSKYVSVNV
jgi:hypothetical protein